MKKRISFEKKTFINIFLILSLVLVFTPLITTFYDTLTRVVMRLDIYRFIQDVIVPWEIRMVGVILWPFGFQPSIVGEYLAIGSKEPFLIEIAWNCIGGASFLFFILTSWIGLQGDRYSNFSKIKAWVIGFLGTFLVNLVRIAIVTLIAFYFGQNIAIIFHDYGSTLFVIIWLLFFWWFSYSFIL